MPRTGRTNDMKQAILSLLFVACVFSHLGHATSLMTPENVTMSGIAQAMRVYQTLHQGQLPTNWTQIREVYDVDQANKNLAGRQSYPIEDHYQFVAQPLQTLDGNAQVLLIRTVPLQRLEDQTHQENNSAQWRYMVTRSKNGVISSTRLPESTVQAMLQKSGVTITPKAGLPKLETDERIPGTEPTPQPNPADAAFLAQHPELDPSRKASSPTPSFSATPLPSLTPQPSPAKPARPMEKEEPSSNLGWFYALGAAVLAGIGYIWHRTRKR